MRKMDNRLNLTSEVRELKLGETFTNPSPRTVFHTLKYDFKPASVDVNKPASLEVGSNKQISVTVPHLDGSGVPNTVFKGNQRDYSKKECVLIINRLTGEVTLEKLSSNIQVKKTRTESKVVQPPPMPPQIKVENSTARQSSKTKITTGSRKNNPISFVPKHSPLQNSPSYPNKSPLSAPAWNANNTQQTLPSIPIIGLDDGSDFMPVSSSSLPPASSQTQQSMHHGGSAHNTSGGSSGSSSGSLSGGMNNNLNNNNNHQNSSSSTSNHNNHGTIHGLPSLGSNNNSNHHNPYNNHHGEANVEVNLPSRSHASPPRDTGFSTGLLSSSSSDSSGSSDSDSGSESDSTTEDNNDSPIKESIFDIGPTRSDNTMNARSLPTHLLTEDLCLSESGDSDSD
ncbi:ell-associated factor Eaf [Toxorhynchites rutilus septentrionalis]|uniref:ell-associated factor Eaf n=1 Tax=Toxorhynchites rutilus septentrionalis TaxID=329112 RepID=UPI00247B0C28|nr:ell-associated factor Eaf [Toxorhynchites rutilus septentrionalis]